MCCRCGDLVLLFVSFAAHCDEFLWGRLLINPRRIGNPPAALGRAAATFGESPASFAACRYVGQVVNLRGGWVPPPVGCKRGSGPIDNRPQLAKLPHEVPATYCSLMPRASMVRAVARSRLARASAKSACARSSRLRALIRSVWRWSTRKTVDVPA